MQSRIWGKLLNSLDLGVRQQVTRTGLLYTLACVLVALAAFSSANNLLFLILAAMLATFMISGLVSRLSLAGLSLDLLLPEHICARRKFHGHVVTENEKRWMPSLSIHLTSSGPGGPIIALYFPVIPSGARLEEPIDLYFEKRGSYRESSFRFSTRFPFGFAERRVNVTVRRDIVVYPSIDPQPGFDELLTSTLGEIESIARGEGYDFYRIRPYDALESARHVDWKATAHMGELQVREFTREQERTVLIFLDLHVYEPDAAWFEHAVDCCAFLAWNLGLRGLRLRFVTAGADIRVPEQAEVYTILKYLATAVAVRGNSPPAPDLRNAYCFLFTPSPQRLAAAGWDITGQYVRVLGPDNFSAGHAMTGEAVRPIR